MAHAKDPSVVANFAALGMLRAARLPTNPRAVRLLRDDIMLLAREDLHDETMIDQARYELTTRIGGISALRSYMDSLRAGEESTEGEDA